MADSGMQSLASWRLLAATVLTTGAIFAPSLASAEIILDDFDDPAQVVSPEMEDEFVVTEGVDDLSATRRIRIAAGQTDVIGSLDANHHTPSALTAILNGHIPAANASQPVFSYQFNYEFSATNVSENGANDALLLDFLSIDGTEPPLFLQFGVWDATHSNTIFLGRILNLPLSSGPFTSIFPFTSFTTRAGTPALPDLSTVNRIDVSLFFLSPSEGIRWSAQLDRIRMSSVSIPEPYSLRLGMVGFLVLAGGRRPWGSHEMRGRR